MIFIISVSIIDDGIEDTTMGGMFQTSDNDDHRLIVQLENFLSCGDTIGKIKVGVRRSMILLRSMESAFKQDTNFRAIIVLMCSSGFAE